MKISGRKNQTGQALVEFVIVAAGALGFLFLFIPLMAKVGEIRFESLQSARYIAWERTVFYDKSKWDSTYKAIKTDADLRRETNNRMLTQASDPIGLNYTSALPLDAFMHFNNRNTSYFGAHEPILRAQSTSSLPMYLSMRQSNSSAPSVGLPMGGQAFRVLNMPELPTDGLYRGYTMLEMKPLNWWQEFQETVTPSDTNVILADGWTPGTGVGLQSKMKEGYFTTLNNEMIRGLNTISGVLNVACIGVVIKCGRDLEDDRLSPTSASPQHVPEQRLENYR